MWYNQIKSKTKTTKQHLFTVVAHACGDSNPTIVNADNSDIAYYCKYLPYRSDNKDCKPISLRKYTMDVILI